MKNERLLHLTSNGTGRVRTLFIFCKGVKIMDVFKNLFLMKNPWMLPLSTNEPETTVTDEEWIWVDGYKGTLEDMTCQGFQYELGKRFDMPEDSDIVECEKGFHLCLNLKDVFSYYEIANSNRFFKVRALVRKSDVENYGQFGGVFGYIPLTRNKLVSKSIEFVSELSIDEIFEPTAYSDMDDELKKLALKDGISEVREKYRKNKLIELGYCEEIANRILAKDKYNIAYDLACQPDISMDTRLLIIFN